MFMEGNQFFVFCESDKLKNISCFVPVLNSNYIRFTIDSD